jgi:hypothetical protein
MGASLHAGAERMDFSLSLECRVVENILQVGYGLSNQGDRPLLAYDGAAGLPPDSKWPALDAQIYISAHGDAAALKRVYPTAPPNKDITFVRMPPLSQVLPRETRRVQFTLRLPLVERSEYTPDFPGAKYQERTVSAVELMVGCFWKSESMEIVPFPSNPKAFRLKAAHGPQQFAAASTPLRVTLRVRTDDKFVRM